MKYSRIQLDDLPDEILIYIFRKLSNVEILYSLDCREGDMKKMEMRLLVILQGQKNT
jgi:hypothetical protein